MTKIVINERHGGFGLSPVAQVRYLELFGKKCYFYKQTKYAHENNGIAEYTRISIKDADTAFTAYTVTKDFGKTTDNLPNDSYWNDSNLERDDPILIQIIEELGERANSKFSELHIVEIPDDVVWEIDEYDGYESIHEKHRSWNSGNV